MKSAGSVASITIVIDVSFANKDAKLKVLGQLRNSRFTNAVPADSDSDSNSIQSLREVATTAAAVVTQSSFLLHNIDPNGIVKNAIDARASRLLTYCETYNCNEKAIEGK